MVPHTHNIEMAALLNFFMSLSVSLQLASANTLTLPQEIHSSCLCCAKNQVDQLCYLSHMQMFLALFYLAKFNALPSASQDVSAPNMYT